jgi:hypothetical protein
LAALSYNVSACTSVLFPIYFSHIEISIHLRLYFTTEFWEAIYYSDVLLEFETDISSTSTLPSIISSLIHKALYPQAVDFDVAKNKKGVATAPLREKATACRKADLIGHKWD